MLEDYPPSPVHDGREQRAGTTDLETDESDVVWVMVVRGKRTALIMSSIEFVGSLISFSLVADTEIPPGSTFMFAMQLITFFTCGLFLIPPFLKRFLTRFKSLGERSRVVVLAIAFISLLVSFLTFLSSIVASRTFEECRNLEHLGPGGCSRMQAAISITFIVSFATFGSFLVIFLGSVIPKDITVKTYIRGLGRAATLAASRGASGRVQDHGFESIPLDVVVHTNRSVAGLEPESPLRWQPDSSEYNYSSRHTDSSSGLLARTNDEPLDMTGNDNDVSSIADDRKSVDAMEII